MIRNDQEWLYLELYPLENINSKILCGIKNSLWALIFIFTSEFQNWSNFKNSLFSQKPRGTKWNSLNAEFWRSTLNMVPARLFLIEIGIWQFDICRYDNNITYSQKPRGTKWNDLNAEFSVPSVMVHHSLRLWKENPKGRQLSLGKRNVLEAWRARQKCRSFKSAYANIMKTCQF